MNATIKDIAKETNLALSTISKYINGGTVRPQNKKKIDDAIQKLNFIPSNTARGLRTSKNYRIALISNPPDNPHGAFLLSQIEEIMRSHGYSLIFISGDIYKKHPNEFIPQLLHSGIDGLIITTLNLIEPICTYIKQAKIPVVELEEHCLSNQSDCVQTSCTTGAYDIVEHLIQMGHKKIALISGPDESVTASERKTGYIRALQDYNIPIIPNYILTGSYHSCFGSDAMHKLWELPDHPSAVFSANYSLCIGIYETIYNLGIRVPDELSVVSFDDFELSQFLYPQLTTVRQPLTELADHACKLLLRRMNGDYNDYPKRIRLKPKCIYRDSVKRILPF